MSIEVGLLFTIFGVVLAYLGYQQSKQKNQNEQTQEEKGEASQNAKLQTQLEYISKGVDEIRIDIKANEKQMIALGERVTRVEESTKQAHKRLDKWEGRFNEN